MDLFGNRRKRTTDKPSTAFVDEVITYLYNADDRITSELLDKQNNGTTDQTTRTLGAVRDNRARRS